MTAIVADTGSADKEPRNGGRLVLKLWLRAGAAAAASFAFGLLYFFVRQHFKDGVWRFDLVLVNKSLGTAALFLVALSMFLTGVAFFSPRSGRSLAYRKHYGLMGFWTGLVHGAVNHFWLPAVGLHPERKLDAWVSDTPGLAALVLFGAMAILSNSWAKGRLGGGDLEKDPSLRGIRGAPVGHGPRGAAQMGELGEIPQDLRFRPALAQPSRRRLRRGGGPPAPGRVGFRRPEKIKLISAFPGP
jgi:hypothetical protein